MNRHLAIALIIAAILTVPAFAQDSAHVDISTSSGSLHVGSDANAKKIGLPLYPGARLKTDEDNKNQANLSLLTDAFGMKLVVANYDSDDAPTKVIDFYRDKLKKYGKVLECHTHKHGGDIEVHDDDKDSKDGNEKDSNELKCDENSGPVVELKVGTKTNQHVVAIESRDSTKSTFALVYVHVRGERGDI